MKNIDEGVQIKFIPIKHPHPHPHTPSPTHTHTPHTHKNTHQHANKQTNKKVINAETNNHILTACAKSNISNWIERVTWE